MALFFELCFNLPSVCLFNDLPVCFHPPPVHSPATLPPPQSHSLTVHPPAHHPRNSYPSTHPSFVCLVCLFVCLSCLPGCLSACLDVYLKVCLACLSVCLACLSVCLACLFVCLSVCLFCLPGCFVCLSVCPACLFICLPIHPPFHVCLSARKPLVSTPARGVTRYYYHNTRFGTAILLGSQHAMLRPPAPDGTTSRQNQNSARRLRPRTERDIITPNVD